MSSELVKHAECTKASPHKGKQPSAASTEGAGAIGRVVRGTALLGASTQRDASSRGRGTPSKLSEAAYDSKILSQPSTWSNMFGLRRRFKDIEPTWSNMEATPMLSSGLSCCSGLLDSEKD